MLSEQSESKHSKCKVPTNSECNSTKYSPQRQEKESLSLIQPPAGASSAVPQASLAPPRGGGAIALSLAGPPAFDSAFHVWLTLGGGKVSHNTPCPHLLAKILFLKERRTNFLKRNHFCSGSSAYSSLLSRPPSSHSRSDSASLSAVFHIALCVPAYPFKRKIFHSPIVRLLT